MEILLSTPALTLYSIALSAIVFILVKKNYISKTTADVAVSLFQFIEENYLGTLNLRGQEKMEFFIKDFVARYRKQFGVIPTQEIISQAVILAEDLVEAQNIAVAKVIVPEG